jgi:hypothetical protein
MDALEAVMNLVKERDDLAHELETYEDWFENLIGEKVTLTVTKKAKTRFIEGTVLEFVEGLGWECHTGIEGDENFTVTFEDFVYGRARIHH